MQTRAIVLEKPKALALRELSLTAPGDEDVVVDIHWSGISTGTERLLWSGEMPPFPGLEYPLVPGYESVGEVVEAGPNAGRRIGEKVFVPGANCFDGVRGLFGGSAARLVLPSARTAVVPENLGERATLLALAATAHHAIRTSTGLPELIIGHGVLGRLMARMTVTFGGAPVVWERNINRHGADGYRVTSPGDDPRRDYATICDVSGDAEILDTLIGRLAKGGEITLAGFYAQRLSFAFPMAFMREIRLKVAAEWSPADMDAVTALVAEGRLSLDGLITHKARPDDAGDAYRTAFEDADCLKMIFDWRDL